MTRVAVATTSALAANAAQQIASAGGNAVDCAIGTAITSMNTEPGVCAFAGGAYVTVWAPGRDPVTVDGIHTIPGLGLRPEERGHGATQVDMEYGGGMSTLVGPGSVAVPGALAAFERAWQTFGTVPWKSLFAPTIAATRDGFPLPRSCFYYLTYTGRDIFARADDGYYALHDRANHLREAGSLIVVPHLADSLQAIADEGAEVFYQGDLARAITEHVREGGGALTMQDMASYRAVERAALVSDVGEWSIATNPPPAIGGAVLTAMLLACAELPSDRWDSLSLEKLIRVHRACLDFRRDHLDLADDVGEAASRLIDAAGSSHLLSRWTSASTVHTSAVDENGIGCSITASAGYGSGEMPANTGLWLNNALGELELNRRGTTPGDPGARLPSNMAPSVARTRETVLAIGTPGADRITTALHQVLANLFNMKMTLQDAVAHPRVHVDTSGVTDRLVAEPGLDLPETDLPLRQYETPNMYFGGVGAALYDKTSGFVVASDPRREGGTSVSDA